MGFIEKPLDDVEEPTYGPEGLYDLVIDKADDKMDGDHRKGIFFVIKIEKAPNNLDPSDLGNVLHNFSMIPVDADEQKAKNIQLFGKKFCHLFGVNTKGRMLSSLTATEFIGKRAKAVPVKVDNYQGNITNKINLQAVKLPQVKK